MIAVEQPWIAKKNPSAPASITADIWIAQIVGDRVQRAVDHRRVGLHVLEKEIASFDEIHRFGQRTERCHDDRRFVTDALAQEFDGFDPLLDIPRVGWIDRFDEQPVIDRSGSTCEGMDREYPASP